MFVDDKILFWRQTERSLRSCEGQALSKSTISHMVSIVVQTWNS